MIRALPFLALVACAAAKPVVASSRPNGDAVIADANHRWETYMTAQADALKVALAKASDATPGEAPDARMAPPQSAATSDSTSFWLPDEERFEVRFTYSIKMTQSWSFEGGCAKYRNWPPPTEPQSQPSPMPCPPPMPTFKSRAYTADMGLVVEYGAAGNFLAQHPKFPAPVHPKPASPKR